MNLYRMSEEISNAGLLSIMLRLSQTTALDASIFAAAQGTDLCPVCETQWLFPAATAAIIPSSGACGDAPAKPFAAFCRQPAAGTEKWPRDVVQHPIIQRPRASLDPPPSPLPARQLCAGADTLFIASPRCTVPPGHASAAPLGLCLLVGRCGGGRFSVIPSKAP